MATTNVVSTYNGATPFDVSVIACNLLEDVSVKDFSIVNTTDSVIESTANWTKVSQNLIRYTGGSVTLGSGDVIEVRRKTPNSVIQSVNYYDRFSSDLWNDELDRVVRRAEEADTNGVGPEAAGVAVTPLDGAYGVSWDGDIIRPPTRNAVYDYVNTLAPLASPPLTGVPTTPTIGSVEASTRVLNHQDAFTQLALKAPLASPSLTGTPLAVSITPNYVAASTAQILTHADFNNLASSKFPVLAQSAATQTPITANTATTVAFGTVGRNFGTTFNTGNNRFTSPLSGYYKVSAIVSFNSTGGTPPTSHRADVDIYLNSAFYTRMAGSTCLNQFGCYGGPVVLYIAATSYIEIVATYFPTGGAGYTLQFGSFGTNLLTVEFLCT